MPKWQANAENHIFVLAPLAPFRRFTGEGLEVKGLVLRALERATRS